MSEVNKMISDVSSLSKKIAKDLDTLSSVYHRLFDDINHRFKEELLRQNGKINGLEDFYSLVILLKGDKTKVRNALSILGGLKDISQFNVSEEALEEERDRKAEAEEMINILEQVSERDHVEAVEFPETTIDEILEETDDK